MRVTAYLLSQLRGAPATTAQQVGATAREKHLFPTAYPTSLPTFMSMLSVPIHRQSQQCSSSRGKFLASRLSTRTFLYPRTCMKCEHLNPTRTTCGWTDKWVPCGSRSRCKESQPLPVFAVNALRTSAMCEGSWRHSPVTKGPLQHQGVATWLGCIYGA